MKNTIRLISLILAVVMLSSVFVACNNDNSNNNDNNNNASTDDVNASGKKPLTGVNWEGEEYRVLGWDNDLMAFKNFEVDYEEMPEDIVGLAVWNRNNIIKDKYGLDVVGTLVTGRSETEAKVFLEAGDDLYDLIICGNNRLLTFAMEGFLVNIKDIEYVDLTKDCWNQSVNEQFTYGDKLFYTTSKFLLQDKHRTWMLWYNRTLAEQLNVGYLEDEVFAGTWTIDRVIEIARTCSANTDGNDGMTYGDRWGFTAADPYVYGQLAYGCGFRLSDKAENGYPELVGPTDEIIAILDKVFVLAGDQSTAFFSECRPNADENQMDKGEGIYREGRAVIMGEAISYLDDLHKLNFDYGALPNPKYTVDQENYYSVPNVNNGTLFAVPSTVSDIEKAGFGLEALSEESVDTSYRVYIEERCKLQDSLDQDMAKCLGIIFDGVVYDIAFVDDFGGLGKLIYGTLVKSGSNSFARQYDKLYKKAGNQLKQIKIKFDALDSIG